MTPRTPLGRVRREGDGYTPGGQRLSEATAQVGIIGGSGLYEMEGVTGAREIAVETPFGPPSDRIVLGTLEGRTVAFLPRHGRGHRLSPSEINFRANVYALKTLGRRAHPLRLRGGLPQGEVRAPAHGGPRPVRGSDLPAGLHLLRARAGGPRRLRASLLRGPAGACWPRPARTAGATVHEGGTYICIEGPQFSTRAESELYRSWGMDIIGMTNLQEARLAREAEICYSTLAMVTDYDCWHPDHDAVTVDQIIHNLVTNAATAKAVLRAAVKAPAGGRAAAASARARSRTP